MSSFIAPFGWANKNNNYAAQNKLSKIKVVKLNLDIQAWWDKAERDRIIKAME